VLELFKTNENTFTDNWLGDEPPKDIPKKYNWYELISAYHKGLRLGNVHNVKFWARLLGRKKAESYLVNIVLEETSNFKLLRYIQDPATSFTEKLLTFCGTQKKWEQEAKMQYFQRVIQLLNVQTDSIWIESKQIPKPFVTAWKRKDFTRLSQLFWQYKYSHYTIRNTLWKSLASEYNLQFINNWKFHEQVSLLRLHCFYSEDDHEDFKLITVEDEPIDFHQEKDIPLYALDKHTRKGKRRIALHWNHIKPNTPLPNNLDLRYSGVTPYIWWRCLAYAQYRSIEVPWESVYYPEKDFQTLISMI